MKIDMTDCYENTVAREVCCLPSRYENTCPDEIGVSSHLEGED